MRWLVAYALTIPAANWALGHLGWCSGSGPCLLPVGLGLWAPSGVLFAGLAFTFRDLVQEQLGKAWAMAAIGAGALLSLAVSDPFVALASASAFLVSELADFAVYTPLRRRTRLGAVAASNGVGLVVDSALFLWLAFGSLDFLAGQVVGKLLMTLLAVAGLALARRRRSRIWTQSHALPLPAQR